jgi:ribose-phosphate pyrophosphokinase
MKLRYRILQSRWPGGQDWQNVGFFYRRDKREDGEARLMCHHNLNELQRIVCQMEETIRTENLGLRNAHKAVAACGDDYRVLDKSHTYEGQEQTLSAAVNAIEAAVLGLPPLAPASLPSNGMRIFAGRANRQLAHRVAHLLGLDLSAVSITQLPDTEVHVQLDEAVRRKDVFVIQPCTAPVNDHLVELMLLVDAFRRASAGSITAIMPYYPYARQERMARGREAISARVVASTLEALGADRVIYIDIHSEATQGFFTVPVDRLQAFPILTDYFRGKPFLKNAVVAAPDVGRARLAGKYAEALGVPLVVMHKRREPSGKVTAMHIVGDVRGKIPIVIDDIMASGSVLQEIPELFRRGARDEVHLAITHAVLLPSALARLDATWIKELVVTDTVLVPPAKRHPKLKIVSVAPMLAYAVRGIYEGTSISPLWDSDAVRKLGFRKTSEE